jgi:hypothetical protein
VNTYTQFRPIIRCTTLAKFYVTKTPDGVIKSFAASPDDIYVYIFTGVGTVTVAALTAAT